MVGVPHIRIELQGMLCNGAEKWSAGFSTAPPTGGGLADVDQLALDAAVSFNNDFWTTSDINSIMSAADTFTGAKVTQYEGDGTVRAAGQSIIASPSPGFGGSSLPPQCSVVVSLRTPTAGARGRGRMYLPAVGNGKVTSVGRLQSAVRDTIATGMQTFFNNWNSAAGHNPVAVASSVGGFVTTVSRLQVGDVIDTQRRRRDALPEAYINKAVTI